MKRRRFLKVAAACGVILATPGRAFPLFPMEWRGVALGAPASVIIHHEDRDEALRVIQSCVAEIERLERIFSLYRPDSVLVQLNDAGRVDAPPLDLVSLLAICARVWRQSEGAFDPTVQPLWELYARHFSSPDADPAGPDSSDIEQVLPLVGWEGVSFGPEAVTLRRPGMALTLNGVAQGYVTDQVMAVLKRAGMRRTLVDMGELAARGAWNVRLPENRTLRLEDEAIAVSDPDGTRFSPCCHHIFVPGAGRCAPASGPTVVQAETAAVADALSTALAVMKTF